MYFLISSVVAAELLYAASWTFLALIPLGGAYCISQYGALVDVVIPKFCLHVSFAGQQKAKNRLALIRVQCSLVTIAVSSPTPSPPSKTLLNVRRLSFIGSNIERYYLGIHIV